MADIKFLVGGDFLERAKDPIVRKVNIERYNGFKQGFGENNFAVVLARDVFNELNGKGSAPCYALNSDLYPNKTGEGVECDLFLASGFDLVEYQTPTRKTIGTIMDFLDSKEGGGFIGKLVNSKKATLSEDKFDSVRQLLKVGIKVPKTYHFYNLESAVEFFKSATEKEYIVKHRFGEGGEQVYRISVDNLGDLPVDISNYIVQEELDILDERRIIVCCGEILGARNLIDRIRPWENKKTSGRKHKIIPYTPSLEETKGTLKIFQKFGADLGSIDWVYLKDGDLCFLEYNGVGTGYGHKKGPYNFNQTVAEMLKNKYLK